VVAREGRGRGRREGEGEEGGEVTDIKSNNPHLTGGEKQQIQKNEQIFNVWGLYKGLFV